jgi:hypothetical protein
VTRRRRPPSGTRAHVMWCLAWFAIGQLTLTVFLDVRHPEVFDPEFSDHLAVLRRLPPDDPTRPLLLVLGSSRITTDFRPESLPPLSAGGGQVIPFNLSHSGGGPLLNLLEMDRAFRIGCRPRWVVIEAVPALLGVSGQSTAATLASVRDVPLLSRYVPAWKFGYHCLTERVGECGNHRAAIIRRLVPGTTADENAFDAMELDPLGGAAKWEWPDDGPSDVPRRTAVVRAHYAPGLRRLKVDETPDRAVRELITLCRREGATPVLLMSPESTEFRSWYAPEAVQLVADYYRDLSRACAVPVVDARAWMADGDFTDGQHLNPRAAAAFTRRLGREVLVPLVEGRLGCTETAALRAPQP